MGDAQMTKPPATLPVEQVARDIHLIRGQRVLLDSDLAELYGVTTKRFNEQVRRNPERFPADFMFQLSSEEFAALRSQIATSNEKTSGRGGRRSAQAIAVNIEIMRAFVRLRDWLASNKELAAKLGELLRIP